MILVLQWAILKRCPPPPILCTTGLMYDKKNSKRTEIKGEIERRKEKMSMHAGIGHDSEPFAKVISSPVES